MLAPLRLRLHTCSPGSRTRRARYVSYVASSVSSVSVFLRYDGKESVGNLRHFTHVVLVESGLKGTLSALLLSKCERFDFFFSFLSFHHFCHYLYRFDLLANICHDSPAERENVNAEPLQEGSYKVHVQNKAIEQWYEIQDLFVEDTLPQLVGVSESYMLIYEKKKSATSTAAKKAAELQKELYGK